MLPLTYANKNETNIIKKVSGKPEVRQHLADLGFVAGGSISVYNDADNITYTDPDTGNSLLITKNVAIVPSTYVMQYSRDYSLLLKEIQLYSEFRKERE